MRTKQLLPKKKIESGLLILLFGFSLIVGLSVYSVPDNDEPEIVIHSSGAQAEKINAPNSQPDIPQTAQAQAKWTVMVYLDADNNLEAAGIDDLNEMEAVGSTSDVEVVAMVDRVSGYDTTNGDWTESRYYHIQKDTDANTITSTFSAQGEKNMGAAQTLENFIGWAQTTYPADNYALVLWDHGSGPMWGPNAGGICWDDTNGHDYLTLAEIESAMDGKEIDLLGMDACLMASTEFWYGLQSSTDVFVGSEKTEPGDGWPYNTILQWLASNPSATAEQFGEAIVEKYIDSYTGVYENAGIYVTQSAVDATGMDDIASATTDLATALSSQIGLYKLALDTIHPTVISYDDEPYLDLYDFADKVETDIAAVATQAGALKTAISNAVISSDYTGTLTGSNGLTIYFPELLDDFSNTYRSNIFALNTTWDEFLLSYYGATGDDDQFEPNNDFASSRELSVRTYTDLVSNDDDFFNVSVNQDEEITVSIYFTHITGAADLELTIYAENQTILDHSDTTSNNEEVSWICDATQTIFIEITNFEGDGNMVNYDLKIFIPIDDDDYDIEPGNDDFGHATDATGYINNPGPLQNLVCIDADYYKIDAPALDSLVTVNLTYSAAAGILTLEIYSDEDGDPSSVELMASVGTADDNAFYQFGSTITTWDFYIVVLNYENNPNYSLEISADSSIDDMYDAGVPGNDYVNTGSPLSDGFYQNLVCIDNDYYEITLDAGDWLNVTIEFDHEEGDLDLQLHEDTTNYPFIDGSGYWFDSENIIFNVTAFGTYILWVIPYEINLNYTLTINTTQTFTDDHFEEANDAFADDGSLPTLEIGGNYANLAAWNDDWYEMNLYYADTYLFFLEFDENDGMLALLLYDYEGMLIDYSFSTDPNEYLIYAPGDYFYPYTGRLAHYLLVLPLERLGEYNLTFDYEPVVTVDFSWSLESSLHVEFTDLTNHFDYFSYLHWDFGDGNNFSGENSTLDHLYSAPGPYLATLYIVTTYGEIYSESVLIHVYETPTDFLIFLNGTSPLNTSYIQIYWEPLPNAEVIHIYQITSADSSIIGETPLTSDTTGTSAGVSLTAPGSGTFFFALSYENPLGVGYSNVLTIEIIYDNQGSSIIDLLTSPAGLIGISSALVVIFTIRGIRKRKKPKSQMVPNYKDPFSS